jgi:nicotinate-nucleotide adenylyltransferase
MVEMTLLEEPALRVSTLELTPGKPAFTIETLERLRSEAPYDDHVLLIGSDSLAAFDTWHRWQEILATTELGVFARPGFGWQEIRPGFAPELDEAVGRARFTWLESTTHPASSSEIRRCLAAGEPVPEGWLHPRVLAFATKYELYRA